MHDRILLSHCIPNLLGVRLDMERSCCHWHCSSAIWDARLGTGDGREKHCSGLRLFCKSGSNLPGTDFTQKNDAALALADCLHV